MTFQFTHPLWLLALPLALGWVTWLAWKTDVQIQTWRRSVSYTHLTLPTTPYV